ncbi:MspA family porin [Gordonia sp. VNK21]|uniref:MspA family porin n=1 Tax=Gordonia sp. VNK21 TaxID=3382483 RepID=UPI0038D405BC
MTSASAATVLTAGAADAASLPGISKTKKAGGGSVSIRVYDQKSSIQQSVANNPFSREVWLSGKIKVTTGGDIEGASVTPGYLIGCQLNFGAQAGADSGITADGNALATALGDTAAAVIEAASGSAPTTVPDFSDVVAPDDDSTNGPTAGFTLSPGDAKFVPVIRVKVGDEVTNSFTFAKGVGGVTYSQERFGVDGCAGFAEARTIVNVQVSTDTFKGNVTLYGKPFSIG